MIKIAICDDEPCFLDQMEQMLRVYEAQSGQSFLIKKYDHSVRLMDDLKEEFHIYFLDMQMPNMDGLELAKAIRGHDDRSAIIFVTSYREYVFESFQYHAANYITKPITQIQINCEMDRALQKMDRRGQEYLGVKNSNGYRKLFLSDIEYIETYERNVLIHCQDGRKEIGHFKMQELEERLKAFSFIRCHNSYIVNVDYIDQIQGVSVTLLSGDTIYTTRSRRKDLVRKMAEQTGWG